MVCHVISCSSNIWISDCRFNNIFCRFDRLRCWRWFRSRCWRWCWCWRCNRLRCGSFYRSFCNYCVFIRVSFFFCCFVFILICIIINTCAASDNRRSNNTGYQFYFNTFCRCCACLHHRSRILCSHFLIQGIRCIPCVPTFLRTFIRSRCLFFTRFFVCSFFICFTLSISIFVGNILIRIWRFFCIQDIITCNLLSYNLKHFFIRLFIQISKQPDKKWQRCKIVKLCSFFLKLQYFTLNFFASIIQTALYCILTALQFFRNFRHTQLVIIIHSNYNTLVFRQSVKDFSYQSACFFLIHGCFR